LGTLLGHTEYGKFKGATARAESACDGSGQAVSDHFAHVSNMVDIGSGARRQVEDVHLSRYACYLLAQNGDPSKPMVAANGRPRTDVLRGADS
jgi:DNA-damage-inducible protein D